MFHENTLILGIEKEVDKFSHMQTDFMHSNYQQNLDIPSHVTEVTSDQLKQEIELIIMELTTDPGFAVR